MGESSVHISLVTEIYNYAVSMVPEEETSLILIDSPESREKPKRNGDGYRPDVEYYHCRKLIIGDAKTSADLETKHTLRQFESYLCECDRFDGDALFVVAVPFGEAQRACSVISTILHKLGFSVPYAVVTEAGVYCER